MSRFKDKDLLSLHLEFEEYGYCMHNCPECGEEMEPTEADAASAFCSFCDELRPVQPLI